MKKEFEMEEKMIHISAKNFSYVIFGVIIVALIVIGFVVMNSGNKTNSNPIANTPATNNPAAETPTNTPSQTNIPAVTNTDKVVVLSDMMDLDKANDRHKIIFGRVQNTGTTRALSVIITATLYSLNGTMIGKDNTRPFFNDLEPNQTSNFQIDVYDSSYSSTAAYRLSIVSQ